MSVARGQSKDSPCSPHSTKYLWNLWLKIPISRQCSETLERISVKCFGLPGGLVPHSVLIANDLHRHDYAIAAELIVRRNAVVELSARRDGKLDRPRQLVVPEQFELVLAGICRKREYLTKHAWTFAGRVAAFDVRKVAFDARPF